MTDEERLEEIKVRCEAATGQHIDVLWPHTAPQEVKDFLINAAQDEPFLLSLIAKRDEEIAKLKKPGSLGARIGGIRRLLEIPDFSSRSEGDKLKSILDELATLRKVAEAAKEINQFYMCDVSWVDLSTHEVLSARRVELSGILVNLRNALADWRERGKDG